jgi:hypothetical protein
MAISIFEPKEPKKESCRRQKPMKKLIRESLIEVQIRVHFGVIYLYC